MNVVFYISAAVAILATLRVITHTRAVHALLYFIVSLLAVAVIFYTLGAPLAAALEVIIYAGAIMVLFVFVVMMLNLGPETVRQERTYLAPRAWVGPAALAVVLLAEVVYVIVGGAQGQAAGTAIAPEEVGASLFGPYALGVELASMILLAGLVGAYHLGRRDRPLSPREKEIR
jgi:NADH-quinone oxidoreductase subunit J